MNQQSLFFLKLADAQARQIAQLQAQNAELQKRIQEPKKPEFDKQEILQWIRQEIQSQLSQLPDYTSVIENQKEALDSAQKKIESLTHQVSLSLSEMGILKEQVSNLTLALQEAESLKNQMLELESRLQSEQIVNAARSYLALSTVELAYIQQSTTSLPEEHPINGMINQHVDIFNIPRDADGHIVMSNLDAGFLNMIYCALLKDEHRWLDKKHAEEMAELKQANSMDKYKNQYLQQSLSKITCEYDEARKQLEKYKEAVENGKIQFSKMESVKHAKETLEQLLKNLESNFNNIVGEMEVRIRKLRRVKINIIDIMVNALNQNRPLKEVLEEIRKELESEDHINALKALIGRGQHMSSASGVELSNLNPK